MSVKTRFWRCGIVSIILVILGILIIIVLVAALAPFQPVKRPESDLTASYEDAMQRIDVIVEAENTRTDLMPECQTRVMTHGEKVENAIVLYHGFTSCPAQYAELGKQFYDKGYNVLIPLQPHHGEMDRLNPSVGGLTAEELAEFGMQTVDIAQGLGERVTVSGISGGGALTIWLAQERDDIDVAIPVSPFLGINFIPPVLNRPIARVMALLPDIWLWWDPVKKEDNPYVDEFQYPRFTSHALIQYLQLGYTAERDAKKKAPAGKIIMVSNGAEPSVNNDIIDQFVKTWKEHDNSGANMIVSFRFDKYLKLPHDMITPYRFEGNTTIVYPKLFDLLAP